MKSHIRLAAATALRAATMLSVAWLSFSACAAPPEPAPPAPSAPASASATLSPEEWRLRGEWQKAMAQIALPKKGCFHASYPSKEWQEVACIQAPPYPMPPRRGPRPLVVGNGDDVSAEVPAGSFISTAIGSFDSVTGVTSESGPIANAGPPVADAYTLQVNTDFFASTACAGSPNPNCQGWQQFVFFNDGSSGSAFIQYWLIKYNTTCPAGGWNQFSFTGDPDIYCFQSSSAIGVPNQPIANLHQLSLTGTVSAGGDQLVFASGSDVHSVTGLNAVNAAAGWRAAEFNVFGPAGSSSGGSQATFNSGAAIVPRTRVIYGGTAGPSCLAQGFTAESNNLNFGPGAPAASPPGPALIFDESSAGGAASFCAAATSVGDTHLATIHNLLYDFQASGDFVLAEADPGLLVETRQASGAPTWPNAAVNKAIATRMGKTEVAVCLAPNGRDTSSILHVDGKPADLADGKQLSLASGVDITRAGNVYFVVGPGGDSVRAEVNPTWINVSVGLGRWPVKVRGLIGNANDKPDQIEARDGTVLKAPFAFDELYHRYADSWRVPDGDALLSVCGKGTERGIPKAPFYASDLDRQTYERTHAVCTAAGVKPGPLLDACTLDVAVIGNDAAKVFVNAVPPIAVGAIQAAAESGGLGIWKWILLLIAALLILWFLIRKFFSP